MGDRLNELKVKFRRSSVRREKTLKLTADGKLDVTLISTRASTLGYNIQRVGRVIIVNFAYNPI